MISVCWPWRRGSDQHGVKPVGLAEPRVPAGRRTKLLTLLSSSATNIFEEKILPQAGSASSFYSNLLSIFSMLQKLLSLRSQCAKLSYPRLQFPSLCYLLSLWCWPWEWEWAFSPVSITDHSDWFPECMQYILLKERIVLIDERKKIITPFWGLS